MSFYCNIVCKKCFVWRGPYDDTKSKHYFFQFETVTFLSHKVLVWIERVNKKRGLPSNIFLFLKQIQWFFCLLWHCDTLFFYRVSASVCERDRERKREEKECVYMCVRVCVYVYVWERVRVSVYVCLCVWERDRYSVWVCVCILVCVSERESVYLCLLVCVREREREIVCEFVYVFVLVCVCEWKKEWERERDSVCLSVWER